jgi:hypothetical protein
MFCGVWSGTVTDVANAHEVFPLCVCSLSLSYHTKLLRNNWRITKDDDCYISQFIIIPSIMTNDLQNFAPVKTLTVAI